MVWKETSSSGEKYSENWSPYASTNAWIKLSDMCFSEGVVRFLSRRFFTSEIMVIFSHERKDFEEFLSEF